MADKEKEKKEVKIWMVFRYCKDKCLKETCKEFGYFWGPDHPDKAGKHVEFTQRVLTEKDKA